MQSIDEGWQQVFAVSQQHHIEEGGEGFGIGGEHRPASEHDGVVIGAFVAPDGHALLLEQVEQDRSIQFPAQRQPEEVALPVRWISLVGEQSTDVKIGPHRQRGPDNLIAEARDSHRVGAGEGQHRAQGPRLWHCRIEQEGFAVQRGPRIT